MSKKGKRTDKVDLLKPKPSARISVDYSEDVSLEL
jgi:hypothetical protein